VIYRDMVYMQYTKAVTQTATTVYSISWRIVSHATVVVRTNHCQDCRLQLFAYTILLWHVSLFLTFGLTLTYLSFS